ncbi:MAG: hypothetical protein WAN59_11405 [Candidatus Baltobacteraceae bacterium]
MKFDSVVDILARKDVDAIHALVFLMVSSVDPDRDEIVNDSVMAVRDMLAQGLPAKILAPQLGGIVNNHRLRVHARERKAHSRLLEDDSDLLNARDTTTEPERLLTRLEDFREQIIVLKTMKIQRPADFERVVAQYQKKDARGLGVPSGNARKSDAENSADYRARQHAKKLLQQIRKDKSS